MIIQNLNINYTHKLVVPVKLAGVRCPHGSPSGTCPICMGMSGGGGGTTIKHKPTPKELGLLTWADLLPAWNAMQAAKQRNEYNDKMDNLLAIKKFIERSNVYKTLFNFVDTNIKSVIKLFDSKIATPLSKTVNQLRQSINTFMADLKMQVLQQLTKMAFVNEKINQIMDKLKQSTEMLKNAMEIFIANLKHKEKEIKEFLLDFAKKIKKKLFRIIEDVDNSFENVEDQKFNEKIYEELINV